MFSSWFQTSKLKLPLYSASQSEEYCQAQSQGAGKHTLCVMRIQDVNARKDEELSPRIQVEFCSKVIYQKALEKKKKSRDRDQGGPEIQKYNF